MLFDLGRDPREREDRAAERPTEVTRLRQQIMALRERMASASRNFAHKDTRLDEATVRALEALGYAR
jgi:murein tripeptide amidase MpaA